MDTRVRDAMVHQKQNNTYILYDKFTKINKNKKYYKCDKLEEKSSVLHFYSKRLNCVQSVDPTCLSAEQ